MAPLIMMFVSVFSSTASTPCPSLTLIKVCGKMYKAPENSNKYYRKEILFVDDWCVC